jgi:hypothetical protein
MDSSKKNCSKRGNPLKGIGKLNRCEILALINSVSMILSEGLDEEDMEMLGGLLSTIGDTISVFAAVANDTPPTESKK